jgi:hypothetical protein
LRGGAPTLSYSAWISCQRIKGLLPQRCGGSKARALPDGSRRSGKPVGFVQRALPVAASTAVAKVAKHALERALQVALYSLRNRRFTGGRKLHSGLACTSGAIGGAFGLAQRGVGYCSAR